MLGASYLKSRTSTSIQSRLVCELRRNRDAADRRRGSTSLGGEHRIHIGSRAASRSLARHIEAFAFGSNGAVVVADTDLWLTDLFGGVYGDIELGDRLRIYAGVGPTLQFGSIDYDYDDPVLGHVSINDDGFGTGYYSPSASSSRSAQAMAIGASYRYVDSNIDFAADQRHGLEAGSVHVDLHAKLLSASDSSRTVDETEVLATLELTPSKLDAEMFERVVRGCDDAAHDTTTQSCNSRSVVARDGRQGRS